MGPACPVCGKPVGARGLGRRYRDPSGRRCRRCGAVFRLRANGETFGVAGVFVFSALVLAPVWMFVPGAGESTLGLAVSAWLLAALGLGLWIGLKTRRVLPAGDRCAACGYDITGCAGHACPECGVSFFAKPPSPGVGDSG